ncbi:MAG TPA: TonB-dependent receptor plug domain-containing protein [Chitinophagaceae bacterium]|nr:TonB-dependent receptor plug domain-containing protein [Chitinophagaceae bacterium]
MRKASLSVAALTLTLLAQAQQDTATRPLDEVVVTATKYPLKLSQTGKVLSVINRETIERNLGKDLPQLLTEQTSILVNGAFSNPGKDKSLFLRGASNDYTLILLDGVPVNDPSGVGGALDLRLLPLDNIERIEILKGSQSTLYGADAVAGVINIITRKAGPKAIGGFAGASYGSYNTVQANAGVNGRTSALDYNVNYNYTETDGISEALDTTKAANFDKDGFRRHSLQTMLTFHAGKKLHLSPFYRYTWYGGNFDADAFTDADTRFSYLLNNTGALAKLDLPGG